jgi:hypothetical protein
VIGRPTVQPTLYRLLIYPVFLGAGTQLFQDPSLAGALPLIDTKTTAAGVVVVIYEPAGEPQLGSFAVSPVPELILVSVCWRRSRSLAR